MANRPSDSTNNGSKLLRISQIDLRLSENAFLDSYAVQWLIVSNESLTDFAFSLAFQGVSLGSVVKGQNNLI